MTELNFQTIQQQNKDKDPIEGFSSTMTFWWKGGWTEKY